MPIAVTHDYHANVPPELVEAADALVIYKTNPHIDQRERGLQAASILARTIRGEVKPTMALAKPEVLFNIYHHNTSAAPMQPLMQKAIELEGQEGILARSMPRDISMPTCRIWAPLWLLLPMAMRSAPARSAYD